MAKGTASDYNEMSKILRDPIHGSIELPHVLVNIIDTPEFQRLRRIKQLGAASFVYPGAVHTRFEHSIGVCHIAGELIKGLNAQCDDEYDDRYIEPEDALCVQIAALCHDLGHGPFSHIYDELIKFEKEEDHPNWPTDKKTIKLKAHEYRSAEILKKLLKKEGFWGSEPRLPCAKRARALTEDKDLNFIQNLITFSKDYKKAEDKKEFLNVLKLLEARGSRSKNKLFLYEIVANGLTGIDVDKMDYFARDSHGLGLPNRFDWRRYIQVARVIKVKETPEQPQCFRLCTMEKEVDNLYELFHTRAMLHQIAYQHKTANIVHHMIVEGLKSADKCIKVVVKHEGQEEEEKAILDCWSDPEAFHILDDTIVDIILKMEPFTGHTSTKKLSVADHTSTHIKFVSQTGHKEAQYWLKRVVDHRTLPKFVGKFRNIDSEHDETEERKKLIEGAKIGNLYKKYRLIPRVVEIDYGAEGNDPMGKHYFYTKRDQSNPFVMNKDKVSQLFVPPKFEEKSLFWYYDTHKVVVERTGGEIRSVSREELKDAEDCETKLREYLQKCD